MTKHFFLRPGSARTIHQASLRVLEQTGFKLDNEEAADALLSAGARRDAGGRCLIPRRMVNEALEKTRGFPGMKLYDRDGNNPLEFMVGETFFGPGSDALYNIDLDTLQRRPSVLSDVTNNVRIADSLPGFSFMMSMALPRDVEDKKLYPTIFAEMARNTRKPVVATCVGVEDLKHIHKIASIIAGGARKLRERPFFIAYLEPISPLIMDRSSTDRVIFCAKKGIPIMYAAGANCGSGAPVTPEGGVVQGSAESLGGLVLATLFNENIQFVYGANTSAMDMRSTIVCYGDPTWFRTTAMYADLGRYYRLPSWGTAGSSDAFTIDAQAAMEAYEGISLAYMARTTLAHDVGFMAHGELYDARMLILTDMMIGRVNHILKEPDLSGESLAVDIIDEVSRSGDLYLAHFHTASKFRDSLWLPPKYINRKHFNVEYLHDINELLTVEVNEIRARGFRDTLSKSKLARIQKHLDSI